MADTKKKVKRIKSKQTGSPKDMGFQLGGFRSAITKAAGKKKKRIKSYGK